MRRLLIAWGILCAVLLGGAIADSARADILGVEPPFLAFGDPLLAGNETTTFTHAEQTTAKHIQAIQVTAAKTGTVQTLEFRTNGTVNTGVTSLVAGLAKDNTELPEGEPVCEGTFSGTPAINSWISIAGLSCKVTAGQKYWLEWSPQGAEVHYNFSTEAGTGEFLAEALGVEHTNLKATAWEAAKRFKSGPVGFAAQGIEEAGGGATKRLAMLL